MRSRSRSTGLHFFFAQMGHRLVRKQKRLEELSAHTHTVTVSAFGVTDIITSWKLAIYLLLHLLWQGHAPWQLFEIHMRRAKSCESIWGQLSLGSDTMVDRLSRLLPAFMMMGTFDLGQSAVCSCNMLGLPGGFAVSRNEFARRVTYVATMFVVDEGRMKSTWRSWPFPNIIF